MTDFRALCSELIEAIDSETADWEDIEELKARARALLAQPEPEKPSDEDLWELYDDKLGQFGFAEDWPWIRNYARAVLARWGRPTPQPVPVIDRLPSAADCDAEGNCWWFDLHADGAWYVDTFQSCYTHWLPFSALPTPAQ